MLHFALWVTYSCSVCHSKFWGGPCGGITHSTPFTYFAYRWGIVLCKHVFSYMTEAVWSISITGLHGYACNWDVCSQNVFSQKWNYTKNVQPPKALTHYWYCEWWWRTLPLVNACFKLGYFLWLLNSGLLFEIFFHISAPIQKSWGTRKQLIRR